MDNSFKDIDEHVESQIDQHISNICAACGRDRATLSASFERRSNDTSWIDWLNNHAIRWYYIDRCLLSKNSDNLVLAVCENCVDYRRWKSFVCKTQGSYTVLVAGVDFNRREDMP